MALDAMIMLHMCASIVMLHMCANIARATQLLGTVEAACRYVASFRLCYASAARWWMLQSLHCRGVTPQQNFHTRSIAGCCICYYASCRMRLRARCTRPLKQLQPAAEAHPPNSVFVQLNVIC
jgi:hypothetical protein